ncbi:hypothetical protein KAR91_16355 [Candidatus Pacearchaeota archaeon]|nr:hypothetical protein [Candidatus Pacearchaeota archaeon]
MKVILYNPKNGADIKVDQIGLDFKRDTHLETDKKTADYILYNFGFIQKLREGEMPKVSVVPEVEVKVEEKTEKKPVEVKKTVKKKAKKATK